MKKTKLFATIMTICLAITTLAYGVYAATNLSFTIGANIAFEVDNLFVQVNGSVIGAYSDSDDEQTPLVLNDYEIIEYNSSVVVETVNDWNIGTIYFSNTNVNQTIDFVFEITNYTPNETIGVNIIPSDATQTAFTNANLDVTTTYEGDVTTAGFEDTITVTYSLRLPNLTNAVSIADISLNVSIGIINTMPLNLNNGQANSSVQYVGNIIRTAPTSPTKEGFGFVGWCTTEPVAETSIITFPYTVVEVTTLYAKWESLNYDIKATVTPSNGNLLWSGLSQNLQVTSDSTSKLYWSIDSSTNTLTDVAASNVSPITTRKLVTWYEDGSCSGNAIDYEFVFSNETELFGRISNNYILPNDTVANYAKYSNGVIGNYYEGNYEVFYYFPDNTTTSLTSFALPAYVKSGDAQSVKLREIHCNYHDCYDANTSYSIFANCNIQNVDLPSTIVIIGYYTFMNCSSLQKIDISNCTNLAEIGENAFYNCTSLTTIDISNSMTTIGNSFRNTAYYNNSANWTGNVLYLTASDGDTKYLIKANNISLENYEVLENTKIIASWAFYNWTSLTAIDIPNSVTSIGVYAFRDCKSLTSVTIPESVTLIDIWAFYGCSSLTEVIINSSSLATYGNWAFDSCNSNLKIYVPASSLNTYKTATNWTSYSTKMIGFADLTSGQALPTIPMGNYGTATWYSDKACTTAVTGTASATQRYYVKLS